MAEGTLMFVKRSDSEDAQLETVGQPMCPDDEVMLLDEEDNVVPFGEVGEFCVGGPTRSGAISPPGRAQRAPSPMTASTARATCCASTLRATTWWKAGSRTSSTAGGEKISAEEIENLILMHPRCGTWPACRCRMRASASACAPS